MKSRIGSILLILPCFWFACSSDVGPNDSELRVLATPTPERTGTSNLESGKGYSPYNTKTTIEPGYGTEEVSLGIAVQKLIDNIGKPNEAYDYDTPYLSPGCKPYSDLHWIQKPDDDPATNEGDGIYCFAKNQSVYQISFSGPMYFLNNGIGFYSKITDVQEKYPDAELFDLIDTRLTNRVVDRLKYLVIANDGLAFEFSFDESLKSWALWRIFVFERSSHFIPTGCVRGKSDFIPVKPTVR